MNRRVSLHLNQMALLALLGLCASDTGAGATGFAPDLVSSRPELMNNLGDVKESFPKQIELAQRRRSGRDSRPRRSQQDNARDAVRSGAALPLSSIIKGVQVSCTGRFLGAHLIRRGDQLVYRLNILRPSGKRVTIFIDAANGNIVRGRCR
jgi:hypothetical protein